LRALSRKLKSTTCSTVTGRVTLALARMRSIKNWTSSGVTWASLVMTRC
jgi:hypothetical protein